MNKGKVLFVLLCGLLIISIVTPAFAKEWTLEDTRASIKRNGFSWVAGETSISKLPKEIKKLYFNGIKDGGLDISGMKQHVNSKVGFPDYVDWRDLGGKDYTTPIKDQKQCGACWAFGTFAAIEAQIKINLNMDKIFPDLSEQYVVSDCFSGGSCGGSQAYDLARWMETHGVPWETCWPYEAKNATCDGRCTDWDFTQQQIQEMVAITPHGNYDGIKDALANKGCVFAAMRVYNDWQYYKGGIYECDENSGYGGGHMICIIGYNHPENYWIVKNSWGTNWGESGYARVRIGRGDRIGSAGQAYVILNNIANHLWYKSPYPNKFYASGTTTNIEWHSQGVNKVNIYFSSDTGGTYNLVASNVDAAPQSYTWTVPNVESTKCKIKLEDVEHTRQGKCAIGAAITDGVFGIGQQRSVAMTYPKGGETFYNGHKYYLTWDCSANMKNVNIYGSTDGGASWLEDKVANYSNAQNKTYLWTV
ncbi:MAG: hypothetical protein JXA60_09180, partial [Candidatus Coatesbacteria bacterium]|nr:hypothetical protein [Candidatus Coatesbacteria bacterium]